MNPELALKFMENRNAKNKEKQMSSNLLNDERFKSLFSKSDFQVDKNSEDFALLNPVISQIDKSKAKKLQKLLAQQEEMQDKPDEDEPQGNDKHSK